MVGSLQNLTLKLARRGRGQGSFYSLRSRTRKLSMLSYTYSLLHWTNSYYNNTIIKITNSLRSIISFIFLRVKPTNRDE